MTLFEEVALVVQRRDVAQVDACDRERPAPIECLERDRYERTGGCEQDRGIERLGWAGVGRARRGGAEIEGQLLRVSRSRQHVHGRTLLDRDLRDEMRGRAEAVDPEPAAGWELRPSQRAVADDARAEERRRVLVVVAYQARRTRSARRRRPTARIRRRRPSR